MNTDRDRLLKENEERARSIKEELIALREAMLRSENALNVLAIERTNLEDASDEEQIEIPPPLQTYIPPNPTPKPRRIWPKVAAGCVIFAGVLFGLGALGIFDNDGSPPVARRAIRTTPDVAARSAPKENATVVDTFSSIPPSTHAGSTSSKINIAPNEVQNILAGTTYTSEISYSMKCSNVTLVEVQDSPQITLHLNHAPQSFFIPLRTSFRIDNDRMDTVSTLMVFDDSKKHDLEIRFEPSKIPLERKILDVSSSQ